MVQVRNRPVNEESRMNDRYAELAQRARISLLAVEEAGARRDPAADQEMSWAIAEAEDRGAWPEAARLRSLRLVRRARAR